MYYVLPDPFSADLRGSGNKTSESGDSSEFESSEFCGSNELSEFGKFCNSVGTTYLCTWHIDRTWRDWCHFALYHFVYSAKKLFLTLKRYFSIKVALKRQ